MNSLAIWYQGEQAEKEIDVHINFWKLPVMEKGGRFLDVGLNLPESMSVDKINKQMGTEPNIFAPRPSFTTP